MARGRGSAAAAEWQRRREAPFGEDDVPATAAEALGGGAEGGYEQVVDDAHLLADALARGVDERRRRTRTGRWVIVRVLSEDSSSAKRLAALVVMSRGCLTLD